MYNGEKVIVKSNYFVFNHQLQRLNLLKTFVNYVGEEISVADYIEPGYETSEDNRLIITVSRFVQGVNPQELPPNPPFSWIESENAAKAMGKYWGDFRTRSI